MNRKLVAIAALVATAAIAWPATAGAEPPPSNRALIRDCANAKTVDGNKNENSRESNGRVPNSCTIEELSFSEYWERPVKATPDVDNCDGKVDMQIIANRSQTFWQKEGRYELKTIGVGADLFGIVGFGWKQHMATIDLTEKSVSLGSGVFLTIPPGYRAWADWQPLMGERKYKWAIEWGSDYHGQKIWEVHDATRGPILSPDQTLYNEDGTPQTMDEKLRQRLKVEGISKSRWTPHYEWCGAGGQPSKVPPGAKATGILPPSDLKSGESRPWNPATDGPAPQ